MPKLDSSYKIKSKYDIGDYVCFLETQSGVFDDKLMQVTGWNLRGRTVMKQMDGQKRMAIDDCFIRYATEQEIKLGRRIDEL